MKSVGARAFRKLILKSERHASVKLKGEADERVRQLKLITQMKEKKKFNEPQFLDSSARGAAAGNCRMSLAFFEFPICSPTTTADVFHYQICATFAFVRRYSPPGVCRAAKELREAFDFSIKCKCNENKLIIKRSARRLHRAQTLQVGGENHKVKRSVLFTFRRKFFAAPLPCFVYFLLSLSGRVVML